jgi:hypothetical protein
MLTGPIELRQLMPRSRKAWLKAGVVENGELCPTPLGTRGECRAAAHYHCLAGVGNAHREAVSSPWVPGVQSPRGLGWPPRPLCGARSAHGQPQGEADVRLQGVLGG